mmetsp:Transcript_33085/g.87842  ORF Transcript_33085/g.87842 Transcript_33085/m.87842 type:complete len:263 (-) Transcript_33085:9-797(-)
MTSSRDLLPCSAQRTFTSRFLIIMDETFRVVLVERVIRQVHISLRQIFACWRRVSLSAEPGKTLLVKIATERIHRGNEDIQTKVEFEPVEQQRPVNVALNDVAVARLYPILLSASLEKDASSLRSPVGLHDEGFGLLLPHLRVEVLIVLWQHPGPGEEGEVRSGGHASEAVKQTVQRLLVAHLLHAGEEVDPLLLAQPLEGLGAHAVGGVDPHEARVPLPLHLPPPHGLRSRPHHLQRGVVAVAQEHRVPRALLGRAPPQLM